MEFLNVRKWWHPQWGRYGGARRRCESKVMGCPLPYNRLDRNFLLHDNETGDPNEPFADPKLVLRNLRDSWLILNPFEKYGDVWYEDLYGRTYHVASTALFTVLTPFTVPIRFFKKVAKV